MNTLSTIVDGKMLYLSGITLGKKLSDDKSAATPVTLLDVGDGAVWLDTPYSGGRAQLVPGAIKRVEGTDVACAKVNGPRPDLQRQNRRWHLLSQADGGFHIRFVTEPEFYLSIRNAGWPFVLSKTPRIWYTQVGAPAAEESVSPVAEVPDERDAEIAALKAEVAALKAAAQAAIKSLISP
jgi:hypothetical protein